MATARYLITVFTGSMNGAGTDANVFIALTGTNGTSDESQLDNDRDNFEQGTSNTFDLQTFDLGDLTSLKVRQDNSGSRPGWFLSRIDVRNVLTNQEWTFPCNRWLALDEEPGTTDAVLTIS